MYLGLDFGTSGCRAIVINANKEQLAATSQPLPAATQQQNRIQQQASDWIDGLHALFQQLADQIDLTRIQRIAVDGTSGSVLLVSPLGTVLTPALMYNDSSSTNQLPCIKQLCPDKQHITMSASSSLAKALQLAQTLAAGTRFLVLNQADYLSNYLSGRWGFSDYHNMLKMGYDVEQLHWPEWITQLLGKATLPQVLEPGKVISHVDTGLAGQLGLDPSVQICSATTDANAAFLATESTQTGDAVTSLGSTLVVKVLANYPIQDLDSGVYSHKLGDYWLCGGASNAGGSVLKKYFSDSDLQALSAQIDLNQSSGLDYYPLPRPGERFPIMDPAMQPRLTPRPESDVQFLQGMLEGLSRIEKAGYQRLQALGAPPLKRVQSLGGGAANHEWQAMRQQMLNIPVTQAQHPQAAYGSALLALQGLRPFIR